MAKERCIIINSVQPNSVTLELFKVGDRLLLINNMSITDVKSCRNATIMESKGDFDALIERPPNGIQLMVLR